MKQHIGKIAAGIASAMILAAPFAAGALTGGDVQAQIASLMKQISTLQEQIKNLQAISTTPPQQDGIWIPKHRVCDILSRNLSVGVSGDDVLSLQEFLQKEGYLTAKPTGYFGVMTSQAVAKWQAREGVSAVGSLGPVSRERIRIWCGGGGDVSSERFSASPTRGSAPLTVSFNTWLSGFRINTISYVIDYGDGSQENAANCPAPADACTGPGVNTHTYTKDGTYTAVLKKITANNCTATGDTVCAAWYSKEEVVAKTQIVVGSTVTGCTKEYKPVCGAKQVTCITAPCNPIPTTYGNKCEMNNDGAAYLYEGLCRPTTVNPGDDPQCKAYFDGCNTCSRSTPGGPAACTLMYCANPAPAYCKAYFDTASNKPPTISGISGPSTLAVGSTGTWTVNASDPEGAQLSYSISYGDEYSSAPNATAIGIQRVAVQTSTFTHSYSNAGIYTVTIVVQDPSGQSAKTSTTVKVGDDVVACTMEYAPVCGQPAWSCPPGLYCATVMPAPKTYGNRCMMNAEGASFLYNGQCSNPYTY